MAARSFLPVAARAAPSSRPSQMLPAAARMRSSKDFETTIRDGVRVGRPSVVVHANRPGMPDGGQVHVGFVVSRKVGGAIIRNRVKRRLRHLASAHLRSTPCGVSIVVRALPAAAGEPDRLADDLNAAWQGCLRRLEVQG